MKHIQQETRCRVQIKGRGSGFMEQSTGQESDEPMYLHVAGPDAKDVERAKELCEDLLKNVTEQYERFKEQPPRQQGYNYNQNRGNYGGYGQAGSPHPAMSPTSQAGSPTDYAAQYAQYYGGQDPYAAYGGYQAYMQYYQYYQQQAAQQQPAPGAPPGTTGAPPGVAPPPPDEAPPPPPPSGSPPVMGGGYNAVSMPW